MSRDFKYETILITYTDKVLEHLDYPLKGPLGGSGLYVYINPRQWRVDGVEILFTDVHSSQIKDGFEVLIHEPFEVPSKDSVEVQALSHQTITFLVTPEITQIEDSMKQLNPDE